MLTLEQILQRFTARPTLEPPDTAVEPVTPVEQRPVVINGLGQLLMYLANLDKRVTALEQYLKELRERGTS